MLIGCYYRCPIQLEERDRDYPRFFVLAQLQEYNEIADTATVKMHDLLGSSDFYDEIFKYDTFRAPDLERCAAISGELVNSSWGLGTIVTHIGELDGDKPYSYYIRLQNGKYIEAEESELQIEYSQMDYPPLRQLLNYEFQHPTWFLNRLKVSRNLHIINNAAYGFKVLAGCRAFLLPHQISTVVRCFESSPIRFMLADEVGLGKTVEACSILKIFASEKKDLRTLIIVPAALVSQWQSEMLYKYNLRAQFGSAKSNICIIALEDLNSVRDILSSSWDMVIVDETHRLLTHNDWYEKVLTLSRETDHLLLLSATPIQDRNEEYRRLLALLSPDQYESMTEEHFAWLVKKQKSVQQSVNQQLQRMDRYEEYRDIILERLNSISESLEDKTLAKILSSVNINSEDCGKELVSQSLSYICENYRVERKVIRNRRQLISEKMAKRTLSELPYTPLSANELYNEAGAIQNVLSYLSENNDGTEEYVISVAIPLFGSLFSSPWALTEMLTRLQIKDVGLIDSAQVWRKQAQMEHTNANQALDEDPDLVKGRLLWALNYFDQETDISDDPECKIVVFTGYNATLREFHRLFNNRYEPNGIRSVAFGSHMSREDLEDSIYDFQNDPSCRVIVCDETGGEGRNFQNAVLLLHLDLPWNANALEQRIGRLDRLGRDPDMDVHSVVIYAEGSVEEQLFHVWRDGMKLFKQSLSGLEIITGELNRLITAALQDDFYNGLLNAFDDIVDESEKMRESVEDEQLFDVGATLYRPLSLGIDNVLQLYAEEEDNLFALAMLGWSSQAGMQTEKPTKDGLVEVKESHFSPRAAIQSLFIPPRWELYNATSIMRREGKILGSFDRKLVATREDILFFAPGDPVYDSIISNAIGCSRGRCSAFAIIGTFRYAGLIFSFNIEPDVKELLASGINPKILSQFKMFLPLSHIVIPIGLNEASRAIPDKDVLHALYNAKPLKADHLGRRGGTRSTESPLERFISQNPLSSWEPLVTKCAEQASRIATIQMREFSDINSAQREMSRIINGYRSECLYFERDATIVDEMRNSLSIALRALKNAKPKLDSVCFLRVVPNE